MALICDTRTHRVERVRRGCYFIQVWNRCPNPTGTNLVAWFQGNKRRAIAYAEQLATLPASFRGSGQPVPAPASR
ncbi:MAG: hypothetical protein AAFN13_07190 [Bacteroidota bacterium]